VEPDIKTSPRYRVTFVVNQVINPMISGFNKVASAFGVKSSVGRSAGSGRRPDPGRRLIPRQHARRCRDGRVHHAADKTARYLPVLQAMHSGSWPGTRWVGSSTSAKTWSGGDDPAKFIKGPIDARWHSSGGRHDPGHGRRAGRKLLDGLMTWIGGLFAGRSAAGSPATGSLGMDSSGDGVDRRPRVMGSDHGRYWLTIEARRFQAVPSRWTRSREAMPAMGGAVQYPRSHPARGARFARPNG